MKRIVVLSDGTGNSSGKLFKTNVWRLYQALDLTRAGDGVVQQVAFFDDGVGTSSFKPLAILGGALGWGLKRNVLDLYGYLCRTWEPGDEIYAFGFSRGAFTIRVLVGFVADQGLLRNCSDVELAYAAKDAYRAYRRRFNPTLGLVGPLRSFRDFIIRGYRRLARQTAYTDLPYRRWPDSSKPSATSARDEVPTIRFVGVWDTVAAYGTPVAELTRGIDDWVWPLSMPDYALSPKVQVARHALALDDERDTFHPLLWDEVEEHRRAEAGIVPGGRLRQVWFAGMHADIGGGYADDSLSHPPLHWMMSESELGGSGLRFRPGALQQVAPPGSASAPIHDSRRGLAGYYRYQPRKIAARLDPPDPTARIMQDPDRTMWPLLRSVTVHESVVERIRSGVDRYAPIVLPRDYTVDCWNGEFAARPESDTDADARVGGQAQVWNDVWRKRVNYFATVAISVVLVLLPLLEQQSSLLQASFLAQLDQLAKPLIWWLPPLIEFVGRFLPEFTHVWLHSFARSPVVFLVLLVALAALLLRGGALQRRIQGRMYWLWRSQHGQSANPPKPGWAERWIQVLRTHPVYQAVLQNLKWRVVPFVFGISILATLVVAAVVVVIGVRLS
ncbi:MAG: DUF2235 domain-containing protein [Rhodospirillales bacterium]|nr:DUF2235 domain-containing protein [Rhodospirillales bacterium]